ncbi:Asp-tRNA(Asn)/Glu-tRNA(Gln) amidotransferase subunit GatC [Candidatus Daviesbacteria bacterium]|nr:Asp-tRNA(Asn)/Glu-tRNA(Gln) amidotransferase subunit GatC [Candidatus Daviesbacteria bacterium]
MKLTDIQVKHVAKLANLPLSSEELKKYGEQLSKILDYIEQLNKIDTSKVNPTFNVVDKKNVWDEDIVKPSLSQEQALQNGQTKNDYFITKGVFEEE